jgi:F-type H+-transporting ATPase subunit delta
MDGSQVVKRYADGFIEFAKETIGLTEALEEMRDLRSVFRDNPEFEAFLNNPSIGYADKCRAIKDTLSKNFSDETLILLMLLLKKDRMDEFDRIVEYSRVKYEHGDEVSAVLHASYPLDTNIIGRIKNDLEGALDKKLHMYMDLNPGLLGGVRAEIEHIVIDGSLKKRLDDLKRKLMSVRVS